MQPGWQFRSAMAAEGKKEPKSHVSRREKAITHLTAERDEMLRKGELPEGEKKELLRRLGVRKPSYDTFPAEEGEETGRKMAHPLDTPAPPGRCPDPMKLSLSLRTDATNAATPSSENP